MIEIIRTNDPVLISFATSLLKDAGIKTMVADEHMSILDGSLGILPRRLMVVDDDADEARTILRDAGIGAELRPEK